MSEAGLSTCIVAVSGGVDSAVVLALVVHASKQKGSPIKNIWPLTLPVYHDEYTKNQDVATRRAVELCDALSLECKNIDLTRTFDALKEAVDSAIGIKVNPGQLDKGLPMCEHLRIIMRRASLHN